MKYPNIHREMNSITVEFSEEVQQSIPKSLEMVIDLDQWAEVLGIEILNLIFQVGENCLEVIKKNIVNQDNGLKYSYDEESDAFWFQLKRGKSLHQIPVTGTIFLDNVGRIVGLNAKWRVPET